MAKPATNHFCVKHYYISNNDQPKGPFALEQLPAHGLTATSMIWHEEMTDWQPASTVASVSALLPKLPPPLPGTLPPPAKNGTTRSNISPAPALRATASANKFSSPAVATATRKWWALGGGAVVIITLLVTGFIYKSESNAAELRATQELQSAAVSQQATEAQQSAEVQQAVEAQQSAEAQRATEAQQAAEAEQRAAKRAWHREHFLEYVAVDVLPNYSVGTFGGISNGYFQFTNNSGYRLRNVVVAINYIKSDGGLYTTNYLTIDELAPHTPTTQAIPDSQRGIRVYGDIDHLEAPGLEYVYDAQLAEDAAMSKADHLVEEQ